MILYINTEDVHANNFLYITSVMYRADVCLCQSLHVRHVMRSTGFVLALSTVITKTIKSSMISYACFVVMCSYVYVIKSCASIKLLSRPSLNHDVL